MRVSDFDPSLNPRQVNRNSRAQDAGSVYRSGANAGPDEADASSDSVQLSGISQVLNAGATRRTDQIAQLTSLVRSGRYDVPSADLSRSVVRETLARSRGQQ
jgi:hypothetical protein